MRRRVVAFVNILLLFALPLLVYGLRLLAISSTEDVRLLVHGGLAVLAYALAVLGCWQLWQRGQSNETLRVGADRTVAGRDPGQNPRPSARRVLVRSPRFGPSQGSACW